MKKYYYSNGKDREGPVTLAELESLGDLRPETLVWCKGLRSWVHADELEELCDIFAPPPIADAEPPAAVISRSKWSGFKKILHLFSFRGRIDRLEYGISFIINYIIVRGISMKALDDTLFDLIEYSFTFWYPFPAEDGGTLGVNGVNIIVQELVKLFPDGGNVSLSNVIAWIIMVLNTWFIFAQGSKRCHDGGINGWWQLVPGSPFILSLIRGKRGSNRYGVAPDPSPLLKATKEQWWVGVLLVLVCIVLYFPITSFIKLLGF
jgi:uncharacterized membrane protein YhaH (DUF805 family)